MRTRRFALLSLLALPLLACEPADSVEDAPYLKAEEGKEDSSVEAVFLQFEFDTELRTDSLWDQKQTVQDHLLYTIGQLNGHNSVGRLDKVELTNVSQSTVEGKTVLKYHAKLPVAWGEKTSIPKTFKMTLPRDISYSGQEAFTKKYKDSCVDWAAHEVDSGSMWYYFRPEDSGCKLDQADIIVSEATVTASNTTTTGKYPEYDKVWEDGELKVVAIFGKYEEGDTTDSDAGIAGSTT